MAHQSPMIVKGLGPMLYESIRNMTRDVVQASAPPIPITPQPVYDGRYYPMRQDVSPKSAPKPMITVAETSRGLEHQQVNPPPIISIVPTTTEQTPVNPYQVPVSQPVGSGGYHGQYQPIPFNQDQSGWAAPPSNPPPGGQQYQQFEQKLSESIDNILRQQFGLQPKSRSVTYRKPYPEAMDRVPYPMGYRVPDFTKFDGTYRKSVV